MQHSINMFRNVPTENDRNVVSFKRKLWFDKFRSVNYFECDWKVKSKAAVRISFSVTYIIVDW